MVTKPDQSTDEGDGVVQDNSNGTKKAAKTTRRSPRKKTTAKSTRRKPPARTVAPPPLLTIEELKEQGVHAKQEIVSAVLEPAVEAVGFLSQTIRDTISGAFSGLLSRKRRDD
jgi:hypothetical protein